MSANGTGTASQRSKQSRSSASAAAKRYLRSGVFSRQRKQMRSMPSGDPQDPGYRRLRYCRYADDTLLGFTGPKAEAEEIKSRLAQFLRDDLKLELSRDKTLVTHARTGAARCCPPTCVRTAASP